MSRRKSRKLAFQTLFQVDQVNAEPLQAIEWLVEQTKINEEDMHYSQELVEGVIRHQAEIDALLSQLSQSWKIERMFAVDRVVLRMGSYEILFGNVPAPIAIDEAIEITKTYGDEHSPAFVNALLDQVKKYHEEQNSIQS